MLLLSLILLLRLNTLLVFPPSILRSLFACLPSFILSSIRPPHTSTLLLPLPSTNPKSSAPWTSVLSEPNPQESPSLPSPAPHSLASMVTLEKLEERQADGLRLVAQPNLNPLDSQKAPSQIISHNPHSPRIRRRKIILALAGLICIIIAIIIIIAIVIATHKTHSDPSNSIDSSNGTVITASGDLAKLWGVNGDKITADNGTSFVYKNSLGGTWVAIPFNDTAKCQDDSPPLNQPWDYSHRRILGVNLGGWLVLEPFITPYLFEPFNEPNSNPSSPPTVVDEWSLSTALGDKLATTLEDHYKSFITEQDFMEIAAAGLNWVRIPVGWWMIETWDGEPFLEGISFKYFLKALKWSRKYGLRVNLDLHAVPGSQNGFNHSGKLGSINFLIGLMGIANAQRTFNYIRTLTEFISQPQYVNVVPMFSVLNEALVQKIGSTQIRSFYLQVYQMMRSITGFGMGKGPMMVIHDGFQGPGAGHDGWDGFLKGADRLALDTHTYFAFDKQSNDSLVYNSFKPCTYWSKSFNQTNTNFGFNFAGEYSLAVNDCGLWLNNIGVGSRYDGSYPNLTTPDLKNFPRINSCDLWNDYRNWSVEMKNNIADLAAASQDAMQNTFFWTWKISNSIKNPQFKPNPLWDYQLGIQKGWIRPDARKSIGSCSIIGSRQGITTPVQTWSGEFLDWQIGKNLNQSSSKPPQIDPEQIKLYETWPPNQIFIEQGKDQVYPQVQNLPQYLPNGKIIVLKPDSIDPKELPASSISTDRNNNNIFLDPGTGWSNPQDRSGWYIPIKNCQYPNPWNANGLPPPSTPFCGGNTTPTPST